MEEFSRHSKMKKNQLEECSSWHCKKKSITSDVFPFWSHRVSNYESVIFLTKIFLVLIFIYVIEESVVSEEKENIPFGIFPLWLYQVLR